MTSDNRFIQPDSQEAAAKQADELFIHGLLGTLHDTESRGRRPVFAITTATYGSPIAPTANTHRSGPCTTTTNTTQAVRTAIEIRYRVIRCDRSSECRRGAELIRCTSLGSGVVADGRLSTPPTVRAAVRTGSASGGPVTRLRTPRTC